MRLGLIIITVIQLLFSCKGGIDNSNDVIKDDKEKNSNAVIELNDTIKKVIRYEKWVFKINNKNSENIGYKIYTDDESIGVKALYPDGEYVYITDVYHTNIKRININTGEMKSSKSLSPLPADESGIWLRDLAVFNNKIYAPSDRDTIYVFSTELNKLQSIPVNRDRKYIERVNQNEIEIYLNSNQLPDKTIEKTLLSVNKKGDISTIKKQILIQEYTKRTIQGKPFKTYTKNGKNYFECEYGTIELKTPIPVIKEYGTGNFNFNSTTLVYYNSTPTEFTLYVYQY